MAERGRSLFSFPLMITARLLHSTDVAQSHELSREYALFEELEHARIALPQRGQAKRGCRWPGEKGKRKARGEQKRKKKKQSGRDCIMTNK